MFTGGTIGILTHGHMDARVPARSYDVGLPTRRDCTPAEPTALQLQNHDLKRSSLLDSLQDGLILASYAQ